MISDKKVDPNSEFEGVDQETRGGNLSSSAHDHSSNANLNAGYGTASGFAKSVGVGLGTEATVTKNPQGNSGLKAHQFLNNANWESDAASTGQYFHTQFNNNQGDDNPTYKINMTGQDSPPSGKGMRTDDE